MESFVRHGPSIVWEGLPLAWAPLLADWHKRCWFNKVRHGSLIVRLHSGTRLGDPLADLMFALAFGKVQDGLLVGQWAAGLLCRVPARDGTIFAPGAVVADVELLLPTFMDDVVVFISTRIDFACWRRLLRPRGW